MTSTLILAAVLLAVFFWPLLSRLLRSKPTAQQPQPPSPSNTPPEETIRDLAGHATKTIRRNLPLTPQKVEERKTRGVEILSNREITENTDGTHSIPGSKPGTVYNVNLKAQTCTCPDYIYRGRVFCKHLRAVQFLLTSRDEKKPAAAVALQSSNVIPFAGKGV